MKKIKTLLVTLICICISLSSVTFVSAEDKTLKTLVAEAVFFYKEGSETDVLRTLDTIKQNYPNDYEMYKNIMEYFYYLDSENWVDHLGVAPDGLPNDSTHAFVVLGYQLNTDGTMKNELIGRLEVALACANKYPNSYIVVTGGVEKNGVREADAMKAWLLEKGLDAKRIIVERGSGSTVGNARYTFDILYIKHDDIKTISMVTSQYHLKRGSLMFYAQSLLSAIKYEKAPIELIGNAGWLREDKTSEPLGTIVSSLNSILTITTEYKAVEASNPSKSVLESISVTAPENVDYTLGEELDLTGMIVAASYDTGYSRDITDYVNVTGYDSTKLGSQTITIEYTEKDLNNKEEEIYITKSATFDVFVEDDSSSTPSSSSTSSSSITPSTPSKTESASIAKTGDGNVALIAVLLVGACSAGYVVYKKRKINS